MLSHSKSESDNNKTNIIVKGTSNRLGYLDEVLSSPTNIPRSKKIDSRKIAVILLETNILELQRHLLTVTVQNQVCNNSFYFFVWVCKITQAYLYLLTSTTGKIL